jgi:hypothetical protein
MGLAPGQSAEPLAFAAWLRLQLEPVSFGRAGYWANVIHYNDTLPPEAQAYQIARACCDQLLRRWHMIRDVFAHDLAIELCGVTPHLRAVASR